jgi:hypothetical protein
MNHQLIQGTVTAYASKQCEIIKNFFALNPTWWLVRYHLSPNLLRRYGIFSEFFKKNIKE